MIKPYRILVLLFYVGAMAALILLASPGELPLANNLSLRVFTWEDILDQPQDKADISQVIDLETRIDSLSAQRQEEQTPSPEDSLPSLTPGPKKEISYKAGMVPIEFPANYPMPLTHFFASLDSLSHTPDLVRIIHYGDSQLEGDRITDYFRNRMQEQFGGCGVGTVPINEVVERATIAVETSENWEKYVIYGNDRKLAKHSFYGTTGKLFYFHPEDSATEGTLQKAWINFSKARYSNKRNNTVEHVKLMFRNPNKPLVVAYNFNNLSGGKDTLPATDGFRAHKLLFRESFEFARFDFQSEGQAEIYGVSFDCGQGIAVDNVAMRGSSGTELAAMNRSHLRTQFQALGVKLVIMQFGVNVVPNVLTDYSYYETALYRQLTFLKSLDENLSILVIGVSDMSMKKGPNYVTYPNIALVRQAQKNAAFRAGAAYWDLFSAMGGENSMVSWVNADPPLAAKDFTHFTVKGARLVGEMLFNELMKEYAAYQQEKTAIESATN